MFWSKSLIPTLKEAAQEAESFTHQMMLRAGLIRMLISGVYSYLPLGLRVLKNIEKIIREEMDTAGAAELLLPALQPKELWEKTGRDAVLGDVMIRFVDRRGRNLCLGPTHEEVVTDLVKSYVFSYRQLPLVVYQIQTKFRDEIRPRFGLVRGCEFVMKDAYSFDKDTAGLEKNYHVMYEAYKRIFKRCGINILVVEADSGVMGGKISHEFMAGAREGEDSVYSCAQCNLAKPFKDGQIAPVCQACNTAMEKISALELGHVFQLGTKYSESLGANFADEKDNPVPFIMGCYGIGVSRLLPAIIEHNHDANGIVWPRQVSPYDVLIIPLDINDSKIMDQALSFYKKIQGHDLEVLLDDRDERAGVKFKDADLIGVTAQVIIGKEYLKTGNLELKLRRGNEKFFLTDYEILCKLKEYIRG
ncbi:MAG: proline--tRNA ligase [Candidatus Omnitrophica bacterium]|jgi:prolyl-tRNA synthetase|nr:proline--tRNA ligase [Candidatus Omnitrophota bacterium]